MLKTTPVISKHGFINFLCTYLAIKAQILFISFVHFKYLSYSVTHLNFYKTIYKWTLTCAHRILTEKVYTISPAKNVKVFTAFCLEDFVDFCRFWEPFRLAESSSLASRNLLKKNCHWKKRKRG